jgi:hypothetical protein
MAELSRTNQSSDNHSRVTRTLIDHFFRRFFDNDTVQVEGDTLTTVVRALAIVIAPGIAICFRLMNQYPDPKWSYPRSPWAAIGDQYLFVLLSFVVMGAVSIFEWEMLFPDRLDFLVLSPLSVRPLQMLAAKAAALIGFLALFLFASDIFGIVMLPALSRGDFFRQIYAHAAAVLLAGTFAALLILALGGVLLCVLDAAHFRMVSSLLQMFSVMALALLVLEYVKAGDAMQALLSEPLGIARWMPPVWFLGVYQHLLHGDTAPPFALPMARHALRATAAAAAVALLTYPLAWARMRKLAFEGSSRTRTQPSQWVARLVHAVVRRPGERAVFHFIGQTIARNNRYQVYLAIYGGTGLALAIFYATTLHVNYGGLRPGLSIPGLHAALPLLLFWLIAGLRVTFAFPQNLSAGWVFRITGVSTGECAAAARKWVFLCALALLCSVLVALRAAGWDARHLLVQAACGLCIAVLLTDGFFFSQQTVPFNQPRMPGKTSLPLMLTLYLGVFPMFVSFTIVAEMLIEKHPAKLLLPVVITIAIHTALTLLRHGPGEIEEEMEGYDGEFQLLGLS